MAKAPSQSAMIVCCGLKPGDHWRAIAAKNFNQAVTRRAQAMIICTDRVGTIRRRARSGEPQSPILIVSELAHFSRMISDIYERIESRLKAQNVTARAACERAGLHPDTIRSIRRAIEKGEGRHGISSRTLSLLAPVLGTTPSWLMEGGTGSLKNPGFGNPLHSGLHIVDWEKVPLMAETPIIQPPALVNGWPEGMFGTTCRDRSMNRVAPLGSLLIVDRNDAMPADGTCYLAIYEDAVLFRRWFAHPERLESLTTDDGFSPIFLPARDTAKIIGRVVRVITEL